MSPDAAPMLLELTKTGNNKFKVRTLRGYIRIARQLNVPTEQRIEMCQTALTLAERDEDRSLVLETLGRYPSLTSLKAVTGYLDKPALAKLPVPLPWRSAKSWRTNIRAKWQRP